MSRYWNCNNERDHQREAERDARWRVFPDLSMEHEARRDPHGCGAAYVDRFEEARRERREEEERREAEERAEARHRREERDRLANEEEERERAWAAEQEFRDSDQAEE